MQQRERGARGSDRASGVRDGTPPHHSTPASAAAGGRDDSSDPAGRDAFLDIVAHELRTPVTTIYGGAQLLATRDLSESRRRAVAADIRSEADRLYRLVEDLVVLVRSEPDGVRPVGEPIALGHLVERAIEQTLALHPGVRVRFLGTHDAATDGADEVLVMHVLRNLLDNAVRYGASGEPIEVIVSRSATDVSVRIIHHGGQPAPDVDSFALSPEAPATDAGRAGAGIGLFVAERLVHAMGGRIWASPAGDDRVEFGFALRSSGRRVDA
ncbi:MAG TPA: HAMP domain-containing sensor histidine kinase [Candidatus Limnocylindrales bacterium]|nr:HAMP domain-containing sensor histidine kinase [Candidatus Limnocylindrales bacterium]